MIDAVMDMKAQGLSLRQIASFLDKVGVPTKRRGKAWHPEMVNRILEHGYN
ncbi:MAG: recombinase family protein [Deltaproteobacteria bacterium]|nr:recombinase family protein [Deltaproteobacteria bacterium]